MAQLTVSLPSSLPDDVLDGFDVEIVRWDFDVPAPRSDVDVVVVPGGRGVSIVKELEGLHPRLVQLSAIGYDGLVENAPAGMVFANAATVYETPTAELAVGLILAAERELPRVVLAQQSSTWKRFYARGLADSTVLVIGTGGVGQAIIDRLLPFEVDVMRVASRERDDEDGHVFPTAALPELLPQADIVVLAVPLNDATRHLVDDAFLAAMRDDALLVNIARGPVADTDALLRHVGRLRFALDVTEPEPLPADHPLWQAPGVLIAPHLGGLSAAQFSRENALLRRQIAHVLAGEEPENIVYRS
ncbi:NAD(P)-dependent oxidoreductase [Actinobaculum sp. 313]|uniref:NAD(P)-dependent oxidoreductase n=1 Tax=Actinobaculum sp. 313 TaxID=2495645 RepID=UPI000D528F4A|nr:NAD(P)-dependent oxidoreductase [Actinobaculum sp. 313]AWE42692.1 hydroxyacid dehydrogenase [Actinobaculum sp. 313]